VCSEHPTLTKLIDYEGFCGVHAAEESRMKEVSAAEVKALLANRERFLLLDVRQPEEWAKARIEGATLVPLGQLEARLPELAEWKDARVVAHCHHGGRSAKACEILAGAGFTNVANLVGGIDAWSLTVDPSVPRY
jgi:adenylyltransferase/sulfurtransferase